jgi:AcrR family transcriptional regulator
MDTTQRTDQQRSADRRRRELLEAADRVVLRDGPQASMNAIAAEAGITKPILYRHFGDKGGLYRSLAARQTDELLLGIQAALATPGDVRTRTHVTIDAYLAAIEKRPGVYRFVVGRAAAEEPAVAGYVAHFQRRLADELASVFGTDVGLTPVRAQVWAHAIVGLVRAAGDWWLDDQSVSRPQLVAELVDLLFVGLSAD